MINNKKVWRKSDDALLHERAVAYLQRGEEIDFEAIGQELGRTKRACYDRWNYLYKKKRVVSMQPVQLKDHAYSDLFKSFTESYTNLESIIADLIEENEHLRQKVGRLEEIEKKYNEARNYFKTAM